MNSCGYIYLSDTNTNRQDIMKIVVYNAKRHKDICDDTPYEQYSIDKISRKVLNRESDFSLISYLMLMEIAKNALCLDKLVEYPLSAKYHFDSQGNPVVEMHNTHKEIFSVPHKANIYMEKRVFFNVTDMLTGSALLTVLMSDLICSALNFISYISGYTYDRLFYAVNGRIFLDASVMCLYTDGVKFLKSSFSDNYIKHIGKRYIFSPKTKPQRKILKSHWSTEEQFANPFLEICTQTMRSLTDKNMDIIEHIRNPDIVFSMCKDEINLFAPYIDNLLWQSVLKNYSDFDFVTLDDLLSLGLRDGRDKIKYSAQNNRKFYNANKDRDIAVLYSDGRYIKSLD